MSIQNNFPAIKPTLLLDFANTEELDPRITFTRASTATYYGTQTAKAEENLVLQSQAFETGSWTKTRATVTADSTTAPDGTTTADSLLQQAGQTSAGFARTPSLSVNALEYVFSIFAKPNGKNFLMIQEELLDGTQNRTWFNVSTGTVGTTDPGHVATITASNNGFYRCSIRFTVNAQRTGLLYFYVSDADNSTTVADDSLGLYLWGAQLEQRSAVTAYTATTTQPITNYIPVLQTAASGVARFDHNPTTFESLGLLIEESRTNLATYSEQFDNAAWTKSASSITANTVVSPDGTLNADKLVEDATSASHFVRQNVTSTVGVTYVSSVYLKAAERTSAVVIHFDGSSFCGVSVNLSTGILSAPPSDLSLTNASATATITSVENGWYRVSVSRAQVSTTSTQLRVSLQSGSNGVYTGDGYSGIYIWGAQLEAGAFATSYIPTVASQVTRSADAASMTGTNFSSWYNAAEGTFYAQFIPASSDFGGNKNIFLASDGTTSNFVGLRYGSTGTQTAMAATTSAVSQANVATGTMVAGTSYKLAGVYEANDFAASRNAGTVGTDTSGTVPVVTQAEIGMLAGAAFGTQTISKLAYYPLRVTNAQLQGLTS